MTDGGRGRALRWLLIACALVLIAAVPVIVAIESRPPVRAVLVGTDAQATVGLAAPAPTPTPSPEPRTGLARAAVTAAEAAAGKGTQLGVAVFDRTTGESAVGDRGNEPYYTASLAKVVLAVDMMDRKRFNGLTIPDSDIKLLRRALSASDDNAMNSLWTRYDGEGAATRVRQRLQLSGTSAPRDAAQWGQMSVPATDFVRIWRYVLDELPAADRELMMSAMNSAPATANDGFNQAFGLLSPPVRGSGGPGAVAKQGWMCCLSGQYYLHSSGVVGSDQRFVMVLLTREPRGPGWAAARKSLNDIASAAVRALD